MRTIPPASLAAIAQTSNLEPALIVKVFWGGTTSTNYCDRKFETEGLVGRLMNVTSIEDVVDINSSANSVNMSVTLDDSDGSIKSIYDNNDIHRTYVRVLQWFTEIPLSEAFLIYEGEISSPIVWSEGSRTLKFDIVTKLQDREVGYSAEEGKFPFLPVDLIGVSWPIVFGTVAGAKTLALNETPTAILSSGFGLVGEIEWKKEIDGLQKSIDDANKQALDAYALGLAAAYKAAQYKKFNSGFYPEDPQQADQYDNQAAQYFDQANQYGEERVKLQSQLALKLEERAFQRTLEFRVVPITHSNMPSGTPLTVQINNYTMNALVVGDVMIITNLHQIRDVNVLTGPNNLTFAARLNLYNKEPVDPKFTWFDGGTQIKIFNFPKYYIASIGHVNIINVWGKNKYGRAVVPRGWYTVSYENLGGGLNITKITLPTPLESYPGEWQDGDLEIDVQSLDVGSNVVDIMRWAITNFSSFGIDEASFATVRAQVDPFPANFVLEQRKNVVEFLKEVAFQARCAIWINDRKFYLRFLPVAQAPVDTITDDDIEVASAICTSVESERLVTKFTATWKDRVNQSEVNRIVFRYNVQKYGLNEESYDFYIYRRHDLVAIAAQFWMIRKSMSWKIFQCKLTLNKLNLEAFDTVTLDLSENLVSTGPVDGIIQKATFNPDDDSINLEVWLPVRLGEVTQYNFAYPGDTTDVFPPVTDPNIHTGNPWADAFGQLAPLNSFPPHKPVTFSHADYRYTQGTGQPSNAEPEPPNSTEVVTALAETSPLAAALGPDIFYAPRPPGIDGYNNITNAEIKPLVKTTVAEVTPATFPGFVTTKLDTETFICSIYFQGFTQPPTEQQRVIIRGLPEDEEIPPTYPLAIHRTIYKIQKSLTQTDVVIELWAQPPVWKPSASTTP